MKLYAHPNLNRFATTLGIAAAAAALTHTSAQADTVKMVGATTVLNVVVNPTKSAVEHKSGHTLQIVGSNTGKGLVDLADGGADIAMVSEPMDIAIEAAAVAGRKLDPSMLQFFEVRKDEISFVVHPSNPVSRLTWAQLKDIHVGRVTNWKQLGGADKPIVVYSDSVTGGTRAMVKKTVLEGVEYGPNVKAQTSVKRAAEQVATDEGGIAGVGRGFAEPGRTKILDSTKLERPLGFVTVGAPKPAAKAVIEAFAREARAL